MRPEAQNWYDLADSDYDASLYLFEGARYPQAVYLLCQAVEKILKAAQIEFAGQVPRKTHQLRGIASITSLQFSDEHTHTLRGLDRAYERVRYRDMAQASYNTRAKTEPLMEEGKKLYLWIREQLSTS
jgi:HEPN domain-containing protein